ncbi:hypothetical protein HPB50_008427 [Hyalomma asiaticum]|uniref:Uncharacterized protein n=1 Tax=Hyalomma asiaticum TaxID=266040 RepID=A0ACB7T560_HYAAI|nr:hypothetical protein HPB50_008427 [Hyalomma asiaticum]
MATATAHGLDAAAPTALEPAVPTSVETIAEHPTASSSSNISVVILPYTTCSPLSSIAHSNPLVALASLAAADRTAIMKELHNRFTTRLLFLGTPFAQHTTTANEMIADLATGISSVKMQYGCQPRVSPPVDQLNPPTFVDISSWAAFRGQFESAANLSGWTMGNKAQVLVAQLRGAAAEHFEYIAPPTGYSYEALVSTLESRFGNRQLHQLYLTQPKHVRQGQRDLQALAAYVGNLLRDLTAANAFVDPIDDIHVRRSVRLTRPNAVRSALLIALEGETEERSQSADRTYR